MWRKKHINARILIIEDYKQQREDIREDLEEIPADRRAIFHIGDFRIEEADCLEAGLDQLRAAGRNSMPYHLVLLDLGIPDKPRDPELKADLSQESETNNGFEILRFINREGGALGVIIQSIFSTHDYVRRAFQQNVIEFIGKPLRTEALQTLVLDAWMRVLKRQSDQIFQRRIETLVPLLKTGLIHFMAKPFSQLVLSVSDHVAQLESLAKDRFGIDREDPMAKALSLQKTAIGEARTAWKNHQDALSDQAEQPTVRRLEAILRRLGSELMPCLSVKWTELEIDIPAQSNTRVVTFQNDVYAVLREVILGGIVQLPDSGAATRFTITLEPETVTHVSLRLEDELEPISAEAADRINRGEGIVPDGKLGRAWGLSIVQQVALRGGGQLEVTPNKLQGNIICYKIQTAAAYA
jgi:DNA-binding NarL/FixJ family response regulator